LLFLVVFCPFLCVIYTYFSKILIFCSFLLYFFKKRDHYYRAIVTLIKSSDRELLEFIAVMIFNAEYQKDGAKAIDFVTSVMQKKVSDDESSYIRTGEY